MRKIRFLQCAIYGILAIVGCLKAYSGDMPEWMKKYSVEDVRRNFAEPPMFYAPHVFWFWDDVISDETLAASMAEEMSRQRLNPGYVHARWGYAPGVKALPVEQFLSDTWFRSFGNALGKAKANGLTLGYCDDYSWPSGHAAGRVLQVNPDLKALSLTHKRSVVGEGAEVVCDSIAFAVAGRLTADGLIEASTLRVIGENGCVRWKAPSGKWAVYTYSVVHHPGIDGGRVNYLDPRLMKTFIPLVHERYDSMLKNDMGKGIPGVFVDNEGDYGWKMAWSDYLAKRYREKKGRDIRIWLPLLTDCDDKGLYVVARHDWFDVIADVYNECYFRPLVRWLNERGMYYISNLWEESLQLQTAGVGDLMRSTREVTMPGNDCLMMTSQNVHDFKEIQTVAELEDRPFMSEIMGVAGWIQSPLMMKATVNSVIAYGVSHIVPHGVYMNRSLETIPFPADWYDENPYWNYLHYWTDFARRASFVTRQSKLVADVLLLSPLETIWAFSDSYFNEGKGHLDPWDERAEEANAIHSAAMKHMNEANIDFLIADRHYLDEGVVGPADANKPATISIKGHEFRALVIPPVHILSYSVLKKVYDFARAGGLVIALGELPYGSPEKGLHDKKVMRLSADLKRLGSVIDLSGYDDRKMPEMVRALHERIRPQLRLENAGRLYTAQRRAGTTDLYWMANNTDSIQRFKAWFRDGSGNAEIWDCETGERYGMPFETSKDGYIGINLTLNPYEAYWVALGPACDAPLRMERIVADEIILPDAWRVKYPVGGIVRKSTAKVMYADGEIPDTLKLLPAYDDGHWKYFSRKDDAESKAGYAYWRMNVPIGAQSVVVPEYLHGQSLWIDGVETTVADSTILLPEGSKLIAFVLEHGGDPLHVAPFRFNVAADSGVHGLKCWYDYGLQQYSGYLDYESTVDIEDINAEMFIDLGEVKYMAEVFVNGQSVGARMWAPYRFDISRYLRPGKNELRVRIGNLIANEMWIHDDSGTLREWNWAWAPDPDLSLYSATFTGPVRIISTSQQ